MSIVLAVVSGCSLCNVAVVVGVLSKSLPNLIRVRGHDLRKMLCAQLCTGLFFKLFLHVMQDEACMAPYATMS